MNESRPHPGANPASATDVRAPGITTRLLARKLRGLARGRLTVHLPSGGRIEHAAAQPGLEAVWEIRRWRAVRRLVTGGDLGFADGYIDGDWDTPDLPALLELLVRGIDLQDERYAGFWAKRVWSRLMHWRRANTRTGSRRNIAYHYDLGNDFYRLWLDRSMTYSSAIYADPAQTLEAAQQHKLQRVVDRLQLRGGERVLEIGCGWGTLALRLAPTASHVTALTLSTAQRAWALEQAQREGFADRIAFQMQDYRDVTGRFERIVSVEMFEAVGEAYWPQFFQTLRERLAPGGIAVLQIITIDPARFEGYRRRPDFIQRSIFPGGMLPTAPILETLANQAGLTIANVETFGASYAQTLAEWRRRFVAHWPQIERQGFPPSFRRLWEYYLAYCEAGFRAGSIDVGLYTLNG